MINMKDWVTSVLQMEQRATIPIMTHPGIELISETVENAVRNGEIHYKAIKQLNESYPANACTAIMDLTVEAEAFGAEIRFTEDEVPSVIGRLVTDRESVEKLEVPPLTAGRVPEYLKANRLAAENIKDKPLFGGCIGPYSLAGRLFDLTELMLAAFMDEETVDILLEKCTQFITEYCLAMKETGINGVLIAEPAAGLLSNDDCSRYSSRYVSRIIDKVQDELFMVVLHNCGNTGHCTAAMLETGAMGYHFGNNANMVEILQQCPSDVLVMGNLDPVGVFKMMADKELKNAVSDLLKKTAGYKNFVISSGCDVPPHVPLNNVEAFYSAINIFNKIGI